MNEEKSPKRQQGFGKKAGSVINWMLGILINICAKSNIYASKSASSQSPKTLWVILMEIPLQKVLENN